MMHVIVMMMTTIFLVNSYFEGRSMRVTQQEMEGSHARIVEGAARLMRERGVRSTSVADSMSEAGMTHGGFYRHFKTKDELVIQALRAAFDDFAQPLESRQQFESAEVVAAEYKSLYLSQQHVDNPGVGCPMPALGGDSARESEAVKAEFTAGFRRVRSALSAAQEGTPETETRRRRARSRCSWERCCWLVPRRLRWPPRSSRHVVRHSFASGTRDFFRHARV